MDVRMRYGKKIIKPELWAKARSSSLESQKALAEWLNEAIQEKLDKEKK